MPKHKNLINKQCYTPSICIKMSINVKKKILKNNIQYNNNNNMPGIINAIKYKQEMTEP